MRANAVAAARVEARIRQICCLGLGGEAVMPALLRELHELIPSYGNSFFWCDASGQLSNIYDETPESQKMGPLYAEEYYNRRELEVYSGFTESMRTGNGVLRVEQVYAVDMRAVRRSDFYNLIMRPMGYDQIIQLYLRDHKSGYAAGKLHLQRKRNEPEFSAVEEQRLARLLPFMTHALMRHDEADAALVDSGESGLLIADRDGHLLALSAQGRRLLYLATHEGLGPSAKPVPCDGLPPAVADICRHLNGVFANDADAHSPVVKHRNCWGRFVFRAYWLNGVASQSGRIGITIAREEPLPLRLLRGTRGLPLSRRQREVAILLASGMTHEQIATRLGVTRNTATSHARWIYIKLDVHDSAGLRKRLLDRGPLASAKGISGTSRPPGSLSL